MKKITIICAVITLLLLVSTAICGFWIKSGQPGDISFHIHCGMASLVFCFVTIILMLITFHNQKKEK